MDCFYIVQKVRKKFSTDAYICDKRSRLWSDAAQNVQSLFFLSLRKPSFPGWHHIKIKKNDFVDLAIVKKCRPWSADMAAGLGLHFWYIYKKPGAPPFSHDTGKMQYIILLEGNLEIFAYWYTCTMFFSILDRFLQAYPVFHSKFMRGVQKVSRQAR